jgi:hypothetical protein
MRALAHIPNKTLGRDVTRAEGSDWHKAVDCNDEHINFTMGPQAR